MKKYLLEVIVFLCGAIVMIIELAGSRVLAPYFGTSLIVWSGLIGLILGALSLGYWWGGKIADHEPNWKTFSEIILLSAVFVGLTAIFKEQVLLSLDALINNFKINSIISTAILFVPSSIMLGMVSPYAVRLKIQDVQNSGKTVGNLYAVSTLGSIFGTFLAGFYLLAAVGTTMILYIMAAALVAISFVSFFKSNTKAKIALLIILTFFGSLSVVSKILAARDYTIDVDSAYQRIKIFEKTEQATGKKIRYLKTDNLGTQSGKYLDTNNLVFDYTKFFDLYFHFNPNARNFLMIGGAAYSYPQYLLGTTTNTVITVVEIDPKITELAKKYFGLTENTRMEIIHEDGRIYLNNNNEKFDVIFIDAFKSLTPPYQLTTKEAVQKIYDGLDDEGVALVNIVSAINGEKGDFFRAEYATYKSIFPEVQIFKVHDNDNNASVQNLMLVALKNDFAPRQNKNDYLQKMLNNRFVNQINTGLPILTDDFAPVDVYMLKQAE